MANKEAPFVSRGDGLIVPKGAVDFQGTGGLMVHTGTTAERLVTGLRNGTIRYNTDINGLETYVNSGWTEMILSKPPTIITDVNSVADLNNIHIIKDLTATRSFTMPHATAIGDIIEMILDESITLSNNIQILPTTTDKFNGVNATLTINAAYTIIKFRAIEIGAGSTDWGYIPPVVPDLGIPHSGGGVLTAYKRNELQDGNTYTLPLANSVVADGWVDVELPDIYSASTPTVQRCGSDTITDKDGADTDVLFSGEVSVYIRFTSDGISDWRI